MEDTRLPKCVMFGEMVGGAGCVGGQEKEWIGCFLDDLRPFGINADQWTTAAQDEGELHITAEREAEHFMAKLIVAEKAKTGLRHAVVCPNVTGRTEKRIVQSKRARAGSLALVDRPQVARTCILRAFGLQMSWRLSLILRFVLFCFVFVFMISLKPRPFVQSSFGKQASRYPPVFFLLFFPPFVFLEMSLFPSFFLDHFPFLFVWSTSYVLSFRMVFFYLVTTEWIFDISLCENSIKNQ